MKRAMAMSLVLGLWTALSPAQVPTNPSADTRPKDDATFGNQKSPKKEKAATSRTVSGQVTDETGQVLKGAMVTLTNNKTKERTNFFTKQDGRYHFEDLSFTNDYEVQARYKDKASALRKLSQYDTAPKPVRMLEVDTGANPAAASAKGPTAHR